MMKVNIFEIKDECRKGLTEYSLKAFAMITPCESPVILDMGCGTGVPSLAIAEKYEGTIYAIDSDAPSIERFREKASRSGLSNRINMIHGPVPDMIPQDMKFDIIIAEGLLNVIGFLNGLKIIKEVIRPGGYVIIHDEMKDDETKRRMFTEHGFTLLDTFRLEKDIWWERYYKCLDLKIREADDKEAFKNELDEIDEFNRHPEQFSSTYYILKNNPPEMESR